MPGTYDYWLVALSFGVAVFTSYTVIDLVERVTANRCTVAAGSGAGVGKRTQCLE